MQKQQQNQVNILEFRGPNGHLSNLAAMILEKIGYALSGYSHRRTYRAMLKKNQVEIRISRPMDIAIALARGDADVGITGFDCLCEFPGAKLLLDLRKPVTDLVFALSDIPKFSHIIDLSSFCAHLRRRSVTIHTECPRLVQKYFADHRDYRAICSRRPRLDLGWPVFLSESPLTIRLSFGCTEGNNFFVDCVDTGDTLKVNNCRTIHTVLKRCTPYLAASPYALSDPWKKTEIHRICSRIEAFITSGSSGLPKTGFGIRKQKEYQWSR